MIVLSQWEGPRRERKDSGPESAVVARFRKTRACSPETEGQPLKRSVLTSSHTHTHVCHSPNSSIFHMVSNYVPWQKVGWLWFPSLKLAPPSGTYTGLSVIDKEVRANSEISLHPTRALRLLHVHRHLLPSTGSQSITGRVRLSRRQSYAFELSQGLRMSLESRQKQKRSSWHLVCQFNHQTASPPFNFHCPSHNYIKASLCAWHMAWIKEPNVKCSAWEGDRSENCSSWIGRWSYAHWIQVRTSVSTASELYPRARGQGYHESPGRHWN